MTEHKFTDDEIIRALECCTKTLHSNGEFTCKDCPVNGFCCMNKLMAASLDLINRQKAEIEDLEIKNEHLVCFLAEAREDAIKEFAERLKEKIRVMDRIIIYGEDIDNLVKEMTEGER